MVDGYLLDSILLLTAAVVMVPLSHRLGLGTVLGFLIAGALVGPSGFSFITTVTEIRHFAELGVVFLLFIIGMELKPSRLWLMRRWVFGLGTSQVVVTGAILSGVGMWLGLSTEAALIVGLGLALSSTAFVLQILSDNRALYKTYGKRTFAVLLFQDLAVVPLLALVPLLVAGEFSVGSDMGFAIAEAVLILAVVIVGGHYLLRPLLKMIAATHNRDIFAASAVLIVLGTAALVAQAGFSMALGAFVAGLLIGDSEYRHQVMADIQPFRGFLLGLFFMSVGMSVDLGILFDKPLLFIGLLIALLGIKSIVMWGMARLFGVSQPDAISSALLLAQSGEFGFVIFGVAYTQGLLDALLFQQALLLVALSMAVTPALDRFVQRLEVARTTRAIGADEIPESERGEVIIAGFGRVGRRVARLLRMANTPYIAIDKDPDKVALGREQGFSVFYGDAARHDVLHAAGGDSARLIVISIDNSDAAAALVRDLRKRYPNLPLLARGRDSEICSDLMAEGADEAISESFEASLQLGASTLRRLGFQAALIDQLLHTTRQLQFERLQRSVHKPAAPPSL